MSGVTAHGRPRVRPWCGYGAAVVRLWRAHHDAVEA